MSVIRMEYSESAETMNSPRQRFDSVAFNATTVPLVSRSSAWPSATFPVTSNNAREPRRAVMGGEDWRSSGRPE